MSNQNIIKAEPNVIYIDEIMRLLPHRYPFLLIDRVLDYNVEEGTISTLKNVTINEPFFQGHFPSVPIMPGVLTLEMMAQACGILGIKTLARLHGDDAFERFVYLLSIDNAKFRVPVKPGDTIITKAIFTKQKNDICVFSTSSFVDGKLIASADITAKVNFVKKEK